LPRVLRCVQCSWFRSQRSLVAPSACGDLVPQLGRRRAPAAGCRWAQSPWGAWPCVPACRLLVRSCWLLSACWAAFHTLGFSTPQGGFSRAARAGARGVGPRNHGPAQQGQPGRAAPDERHARAGPRLGGPAQGGRGGRRVGRARRPAGRGAARAAAFHADAGAPRGARPPDSYQVAEVLEPASCAGPSSASRPHARPGAQAPPVRARGSAPASARLPPCCQPARLSSG